MSDNISSEVWTLRLFSNEGKEIKTLNVTLPAGTTIDYVEHQKKNNNSKIHVPKKDEDGKTTETTPVKPTYLHPNYYVHGDRYPHHAYFYQHATMHHPNIMMPTPQHPMFLNPSIPMPKQALTEDQVAAMQKTSASSSSESIAKQEVKDVPIKPFEEVAKSENEKKAKSTLKSALSSSTESVADSPLPDKDFERKDKNQKRSYSDVAASKTSSSQPPPPKPIKKQMHTNAAAQKKSDSIVDKKPSLESVITNQNIEDNYSPLSQDYPASGGYNFFNFRIPLIFQKSALAAKFPQSFKYKLITRAVGYQNMQKVQTFWQKTPKNGFKPDYNPDTAFYFTVFYFWRAVIIDDDKKIEKCHIFNRFYANGEERQCRYGPEDCKYYHMCMICGSTKHSAFQRKSLEDKTYVCKEHAKLVAERSLFISQGVLDSDFTDEINYYENEANSEFESDEQGSTEEVLLQADQKPSLIENPDIFPPLSAKSPARKKKNNSQKDKKIPEKPREQKTNEKETESVATDSPKPASSSSS